MIWPSMPRKLHPRRSKSSFCNLKFWRYRMKNPLEYFWRKNTFCQKSSEWKNPLEYFWRKNTFCQKSSFFEIVVQSKDFVTAPPYILWQHHLIFCDSTTLYFVTAPPRKEKKAKTPKKPKAPKPEKAVKKPAAKKAAPKKK